MYCIKSSYIKLQSPKIVQGNRKIPGKHVNLTSHVVSHCAAFQYSVVSFCICHVRYSCSSGSSSRILTATSLVNGPIDFRPHTESTFLNRSPKKLARVITSITLTPILNLVQICPRGLFGKWVKYNQFFCAVLGTHRQVVGYLA